MFKRRFRAGALLAVFFLSASVHEYAFTLALGYFYPVMFCLFAILGGTVGSHFEPFLSSYNWYCWYQLAGMWIYLLVNLWDMLLRIFQVSPMCMVSQFPLHVFSVHTISCEVSSDFAVSTMSSIRNRQIHWNKFTGTNVWLQFKAQLWAKKEHST